MNQPLGRSCHPVFLPEKKLSPGAHRHLFLPDLPLSATGHGRITQPASPCTARPDTRTQPADVWGIQPSTDRLRRV